MNMYMKLIFALFLFSEIGSSYAQLRKTKELQTEWKFSLEHNNDAYKIAFDDSGWKEVTIPHDWGVDGEFLPHGDGSTGKLPWKGEGWYRLKLNIDKSYKGKRLYLLCDGIMAFPQVYINEKLTGKWDYGYNSFYIDISSFINFDDENTLAIHVDTRKMNSRWYPGAGIYRKIQLIAVDPVHVDIWGTQITTPIIKPAYADVTIATTVKNSSESNSKVKLEHQFYDENDNLVRTDTISGIIPAGGSRNLEITTSIYQPKLWDTENPHLYTVKTNVYRNGTLCDIYKSSFGVRDIKFTPNDGFQLNGKRVQIHGVNQHHGHGPLGAAFYPRAMERQIEILKSMGCNAIRTSHNGPAPELVELCDKMGILVFYEFFDKYNTMIAITDTTNFDGYAQRNVRNFVVRDRNHPSIIIWSVGNEMKDIQFNWDNGFQKLYTMINLTRKYDYTRPVTMGCHRQESASLRHFDYYDVHSWNYGRKYLEARRYDPEKSVIISESASTISTRGYYDFPLPNDKIQYSTSQQATSYDLLATEWSEIGDDDFMWQEEDNFVAGEFVWTGFDYLGEPFPFNTSRSSYFGIVDLCGIPKDRYYLYKSYWKPNETTIHILPHWNWEDKEGDTIPVFVYTNGESAELFLNGKSLGVRKKNVKSENSTERYRLMWNDVVYEPGELKAVAYKDGKILGEETVKTAGAPYELRLTPDRNSIKADGKDLSYILVEAVDKNGNLCPLADNRISIKINGDVRIAGIGNGNQQSLNPFKSSSINLFYGKAMIIVGSNFSETKAKLWVEAEGLKNTSVVINVKIDNLLKN